MKFTKDVKQEDLNQVFYLDKEVNSRQIIIPPYDEITIPSIKLKMQKFGKFSQTLYIKNNLTQLYPIFLHAECGKGELVVTKRG